MRALADIADIRQRRTPPYRLAEPYHPEYPHRAPRSREQASCSGLDHKAGTVLSGTVACTGNKGCRFAATDTKSHAVALANHLDARFHDPRAAGQPARHRLPSLLRPALHRRHRPHGRQGRRRRGLSGRHRRRRRQDQGIARELISAIRFTDLAPILENLFTAYVHTYARTRPSSLQPRHGIATSNRFATRRRPSDADRPLHSRQRTFTPEQRGWLNGFLAGIFSRSRRQHRLPSHLIAQDRRSLRLAVRHRRGSGPQGCQGAQSQGPRRLLLSLEGYTPQPSLAESYAIIIASTYGEGEAPDAVRPFYEQLCLEHFPCCENLSYSVLALGDSTLRALLQIRHRPRQKLASLGGTPHLRSRRLRRRSRRALCAWKTSLYCPHRRHRSRTAYQVSLALYLPFRTCRDQSCPDPHARQPITGADSSTSVPHP